MRILTSLWNGFIDSAPLERNALPVGHRVRDGTLTRDSYVLSERKRTEHIVIVGKTGTGKTSLLKSMLARDIRDGHGFLCIDLHGDLAPFILGQIREREQRDGVDLSSRIIVLDPTDPRRSVGMNALQAHSSIPALISEVVSIFRHRWQLDRLGARTEELLRNSLWVLAERGLTLLELAPFLTDINFRSHLVERCENAEVKAYFRSRYEQLSDPMQVVVREAILNKVSAFTTDPAIRHIVGQRSTFDLTAAMDNGQWIVARLNKGRMGEDSEILASLILARFKNAIFGRKGRRLFTVYADEVQNLVSSGDVLGQLLSEARKFGISIVTANQHLGQYPHEVRSTLLSAGTTIFFRLSPEDAPFVSRALDGGRAMEQRLKELPDRQLIIQSGSRRCEDVAALNVAMNTTDTSDLVRRSNARWSKGRSVIEADIQALRPGSRRETLEEWD